MAINPFGKYAYISDRYGIEDFDEVAMTLGDLAAFVIGARDNGVPDSAQLVLFPQVTVIRQIAVIY
jgi:hypothetical protein